MYIQCTKKLLDKLTLPHEGLADPPSPQYCWHASFFESQQVTYVVLVNDSTFQELFFPIETFQWIDKQILQGIETSMKERGASEDEIRSYLQDAGSPTYGPTSTRAHVARLNGNIQKIRAYLASMQSLRSMLEDDTSLGSLSDHWKEEIMNLLEGETDTRTVRGAWPTANRQPKPKTTT